MGERIKLTKKEAGDAIKGKLSRFFGVNDQEATSEQLYKAVVMVVRDILLEKRKSYHYKVKEAQGKRVYYLCMEYLLGRSLKNNVYNLGIGDALEGALKAYNTNLEELYENEPDAGLGNGGLGRLAACFMDSLASLDYPTMGYSLRYEYGLFKQKIVDGWQMELPDNWLPGGEVWLTQRLDKAFKVKFDGYIVEKWEEGRMRVEHVDATEVEAGPYDMMISGKDSEAVSVLRLWSARSCKSFDMRSFSEGDYMRCVRESGEAELLTKVLYPSDNHFEGKSLRLKQQYLLVSASLQNILKMHYERYGTFDNLPDKASIHINDTHPALCIPELMRLLMDEHGYDWDTAWNMVVRTVAYTNHTVMSEALEKWSEDLIARRLPRIYSIIKEINSRFCAQMWQLFPGDWDKINRMSIISYGQVKMANLSVIGSKKINGVSALHSDIIKESIFKDFNDVYPERFTNVTNGIAYRRWLCQSNPELTSLISDCIGDGFIKDGAQLAKFAQFATDSQVLQRINEIKSTKKKQLADYLRRYTDVKLNPDTLFDVQAKRMHEYKRQLLNVLHIIDLYEELKANPNLDIQPQTFIFGAKAASGYYFAKQIIKLICYLAADIDKNPNKLIREKLKVCYIENYSVTVAEKLMPATEVSEQISQAGKEASGTGNMKFMINGALTIGTMDGANVEMHASVGDENIYIFGLRANEVEELWRKGYNSSYYYNTNPRLRRIINSLKLGYNGESFAFVADYLLTGSPVADPYMCMADFADYAQKRGVMLGDYKDRTLWAQKSLRNVAASGVFSSDRSIKEYAENIWDLKPVK
ncbi:MAG: glycogen/starch/alpha-glucan phosphorylase [Clostridia bacterium]|nr:glycogen/starch/alpha-glucan phosphorylase [Clostridia bacterium]